MSNTGIIGGGAWGTALAAASARAGNNTTLWALEEEVVDAINSKKENSVFLKGHPLPDGIKATNNMSDLRDSDFILMVTPAQFLRSTFEKLKPHIRPDIPLIVCSKGIEKKSGLLMSEILSETTSTNPIAVLSGPTFAAEVANNTPTAITIAAQSEVISEKLTNAIGQKTFRPYWSDDIVGAQIGGAVKNVLAIGCGIVLGKKLGENAHAALITRGMAELIEFGIARGGKASTMMGLSGMGDLILTCSSTQSRNMSLGFSLGQGKTMEEIMATRNSVAEGVHSAEIVYKAANKLGVSMPLSKSIYNILHKGVNVDEEINFLLNKPFSREIKF
ncbi:MAG: NAD(P)H-dependent glycerol-3-phosphate dehydrogenase [Sphingomonadales bacterium]|mgnify:CR=1 FL=1